MTSMNKIAPYILLFVLISGTFVTTLSSISASRLVENSWNTKTPMNHERSNFGLITVDDKIYAIGGSYTTEVPSYNQYPWILTHRVGTNERYDPKTDTWITLEPMPTPRTHFAIATYNDKIYCIGGMTDKKDGYRSFCDNEVYDIATNSWSTKASSPFYGERAVQAHAVNGKIFAISADELFTYNTATDKWTKKTSIPMTIETQDYYYVLASVDDKIIVVAVVNRLYDPPFSPGQMKFIIYDPNTDVWSEEKTVFEFEEAFSGPLQYATGVTTGVYAPKNLYFLGFDRSSMQPFFWVYDHIKDTWSTIQAIDSGGYVAVVNDILYVVRATGTMQYVPMGYRNTAYTTPAPSNSVAPSKPDTSDSAEPLLNAQVVALVIILIVGLGTAGLVFSKNKRKINPQQVIAHA